MKIYANARDFGPRFALEKITEELLINKSAQFTATPQDVDVVLLGMSSSPELAKEELAACEAAVKNGVPFCLFADTFRAWARPWFEPYREVASVLFVVSPAEAEKARELFPNAKIVASGNPTWEDFFFPKYTREEVRQKLGVTENQIMALVPGGKNLAVNMLLFGGVIEAVNIFLLKRTFKIILSVHPADGNYNGNACIYDDLARFSRMKVVVVPKNVFPGPDMIPGCDVVVQSFSTIGIGAACQRKPVIEFLTYAGLANMELQTKVRVPETAELGIADICYGDDIVTLASHIVELSRLESPMRDALLLQQEKVFPLPAEKGAAVKMIISALQELCR